MSIFYWVLWLTSGFLLGLVILRRLRVTLHDLHFQRHLAKEESIAAETISEEDAADPFHDLAGRATSARSLFRKAQGLLKQNDLEGAEYLLTRTLEADESHLDAHHELGLLYMKLHDYPKAELYFSKLVNLKKDPVYYSNLGAALYKQQRLVEAAEAYENAIALDARRAARLQSLGQVYHELGNDERALDCFERASRLKPRNAKLRLTLVDYYERLERKDDALSTLRKLHEMDPYNEDIKLRIRKVQEMA